MQSNELTGYIIRCNVITTRWKYLQWNFCNKIATMRLPDMEAVAHTVIEATSWMDWWMFAARSVALSSSSNAPTFLWLVLDVSCLWLKLHLLCGQSLLISPQRNHKSIHSFLCLLSRCSHLSNQATSHPGSHWGRVPLLPCLQATNLLLPLASAGRRGGFESSLPPSMPQVEGILRQHWLPWSSSGAEGWTVEVLLSGYHIPFHHLPLVSRESVEFPSYSSWSVKAQALQEEVGRMLQKGALELISPAQSGLLQSALSGTEGNGWWVATCDWLVESEQVCRPHHILLGDSLVGLGVNQERGHYVHDRPQGCVFSNSCPFSISSIPVVCCSGKGVPVRALCFGLSTAPQVFTRVFALVSEWVHWRGIWLPLYLDDWLVIMELVSLLQHQEQLLQLCRDLGIIVNWEKSDFKPSSGAQ